MRILLVLIVLIGSGIFNSCSFFLAPYKTPSTGLEMLVAAQTKPSAYGAYLAGRLAHIRQDYSTAADYYIKAINLGAHSPEILGRTYLLLTSEGRISEAAVYAQKALKDGDKSNIIRFIAMTNQLKNGQYDEALKSLNNIKDDVYKKSVLPLFESWVYAAQDNEKTAFKKLSMLKKEPSLNTLYYMHLGMLNDYFGHSEEAKKAFDTVANDETLELSFRSLQIIGNFYIRNGRQQDAVKMVEKYYNKNQTAEMLRELYRQFQNADAENTPKLIDSPQKGEAEALFNVGTVFRNVQLDVSQIFTALALYLNENHDIARVSIADLLEFNHRMSESIAQYEKISPESPVYFMSQLKISSLYIMQGKIAKGLEKLKRLEILYPNSYDVLFHLGETYRMLNRQEQAIHYYQKALSLNDDKENSDWTIYYALGMAYEKNRQWNKAEKALLTAIDKSNRHPIVLNYLGYSWLKHNQNSNEALYMIFDAYRQNPEDGHIVDSLGWALYRMGKYEEAAKVLERASEYLPANAIVYDHLGDAYWQIGRPAEARFQWQHALSLKEDGEELNKDIIKRKIEKGAQLPAALNFNETLLVERLKSLDLSL